MKKIISIFCLCVFIICTGTIGVSAEYKLFEKYRGELYAEIASYNQQEELRHYFDVYIDAEDFCIKDGEGDLLFKKYSKGTIVAPQYVLSQANDKDCFLILDLKTDMENAYPEIEPMRIYAEVSLPTGSSDPLGKDFRLVYFDPITYAAEDISNTIIDSRSENIEFEADKLGIYVFYYNPDVHDVCFYTVGEERDEEGNVTQEAELYAEYKDLGYYDKIVFPEIPQKEGYVFTGWKNMWDGKLQEEEKLSLMALAAKGKPKFIRPQPVRVLNHREIYASWCPIDEYEPISLVLSANTPITKGKENGSKITLTTNYGIFSDNINWPEDWKIVGSDELAIEHVEIVDDKTVELTLSGNSSDIYTESEINVEFLYNLLLPEPVVYEGELVTDYHTKIKMDEDGVMAEWYRSDNAITLERQKRVNSGSGGGGGSTANYTVTFADGESKETVKVKQNKAVSEPEVPEKEGYVFDGWYIDKDYSVKYDFSAKVTRNFTLYAKWNEAEKTENTQITLTVGEKKAVVNGETKENDVAPMIKDDRAFLPARFVAESLGAEVLWDEESKTVTIQKENTKIVLTIGEKDAEINGETIVSDVAPFIENDRTYTPIRLIAEALGADVEWNGEMNKIIITK